MEVDQAIPDCKPEVKDADVKGNGLKRKHGDDANSDSEDFLGFDLGEFEFEAWDSQFHPAFFLQLNKMTAKTWFRTLKSCVTHLRTKWLTRNDCKESEQQTFWILFTWNHSSMVGDESLFSVQVCANSSCACFLTNDVRILEPTLSKEKGEVYYITPTGKKLRTRHEILGQLNDQTLLTINNFTWVVTQTFTWTCS